MAAPPPEAGTNKWKYELTPVMPTTGWKTQQTDDPQLGIINGLVAVATSSISGYFSTEVDLYPKEEGEFANTAAFKTLHSDLLKEIGAFAYLGFFLIVGIAATITGCVWCVKNKCKCCCRTTFKGPGDGRVDTEKPLGTNPQGSTVNIQDSNPSNAESGPQQAPESSDATPAGGPPAQESTEQTPSQENAGAPGDPQQPQSQPSSVQQPSPDAEKERKRVCIITMVAMVSMCVWLLFLFIMVIQTFGANSKLIEGLEGSIEKVRGADADFTLYIDVSIAQLDYALGDTPNNLLHLIQEHIKKCDHKIYLPDPPGPNGQIDCGKLEANLYNAEVNLNDSSKSNLASLRQGLVEAKNNTGEMSKNLEILLKSVDGFIKLISTPLYAAFMVFNLFYFFIFLLLLVGFILALLGKEPSRLKVTGYKIMRGAITLIFIMIMFMVIQLIIMFILGGVIGGILCPGLREFAEPTKPHAPPKPKPGARDFKDLLPPFNEIIRECKKDMPAYVAFQLQDKYTRKTLQDVKAKYKSSALLSDGTRRRQGGAPPPPPIIDPTTKQLTGVHCIHNTTDLAEQKRCLTARDEHNTKRGFHADFTGAAFAEKVSPAETSLNIEADGNGCIDFIDQSIMERIGTCKPAYFALNGAIKVMCENLAGPMISFWFILQFQIFIYIFAIVTALYLERYPFYYTIIKQKG